MCFVYMVRTQLIFLHRIVHWVYNYMFRPCILAIVRLYHKLNKQLCSMCVGYSGGNEILSYSSGWHGQAMPPTTVRRDLVPPRVKILVVS